MLSSIALSRQSKARGYSVLEILIVLSILVVLLSTVFLVSLYRARQLRGKVAEAETMRYQGNSPKVERVSLGRRLVSFRQWLDGRVYESLSKDHREQPLLYRVSQGVPYDMGTDKENNRLARSLIRKAILKTKAGDLKVARNLLREAGLLNPLDPVVYGELARVGYLMNDFDYAMEQVENALELNPEFADAYLVRARVLMSRGKLQNAWQDLEKAASLKHKDPEYFLVVSEYHLKVGNLEKAREFARMFESLMDSAWKIGG